MTRPSRPTGQEHPGTTVERQKHLLVRRGRDAALVSEPVQECFDLGATQLAMMADSMKADESTAPVDYAGLFGAPAVVQQTYSFAQLIQHLYCPQWWQRHCGQRRPQRFAVMDCDV